MQSVWFHKCVAIFLFCAVCLPVAESQESSLPPGFHLQTIASPSIRPSAFAILPNQRFLLLDLYEGTVHLVNSDGTTEVVLTLNVTGDLERGILGVVADPEFDKNGYFFVYYTAGPGSLNYPGEPVNRVSRFQFTVPDGMTVDPQSEKILVDGISASSGFHNGGCLRIGPDQKLYVAVGENTNAVLAQQLDSLHGKILRLNLDGSIPEDNPFVSVPGARPEIWAYGLRNPFRFTIDRSGVLYIGDVGHDLYEEVNRGIPGANYGWPLAEGPEPAGIQGVTYPIYYYSHEKETPDGTFNAAIIGGPRYDRDQFPETYQGSYFFSDYVRGRIRRLVFATATQPEFQETFYSAALAPLDLQVGPDGSLYFVDDALYRIFYDETGNSLPRAHASVTPSSGPTPLQVHLSSADTFDPDNDPLTYFWDFGDGNFSTDPNPVHTYETAGTYSIVLTVSDDRGGQTTAIPVRVSAGSNAPSVTITQPSASLLYRAGDTITFSGNANDPDSGPMEARSLAWLVTFHHDQHTHPFLGPLRGVADGSFAILRSGESSANTWLEIELTATKDNGLATTSTVEIHPKTAVVRLQSDPANIGFLLDGTSVSDGTSFIGVVGFERRIEANATGVIAGRTYQFTGWSNGGERAQILRTPEVDTVFTAKYSQVPNPVPQLAALSPPIQIAGSQGFSMLVNGGQFVVDSVVLWNGSVRPTTFVDANTLRVDIPASDIANPGTADVRVTTPSPGGGSSRIMIFGIDTSLQLFSESIPDNIIVSDGSPVTIPIGRPVPTDFSVECVNIPAGITCRFDPGTNALAITASGDLAKGDYQILVLIVGHQRPVVGWDPTAPKFLAAILVPLIFTRRRNPLLLLVLFAGLFLTSCGHDQNAVTQPDVKLELIQNSQVVTLTVAR